MKITFLQFVPTATALSSFFLSITCAYQRPHCSGWPSSAAWSELAQNLSASLHGPFSSGSLSYVWNCYLTSQERVNLLDRGRGLCVARHACIHDACNAPAAPLALPAYTVEAKNVQDVQLAVQFANTYDLPVAVKSSGHSFEGQSTADDALLIWMRHFDLSSSSSSPRNIQDSCGNTYTTIPVAGGQNFDDVFFRQIRNEHHISSGSCQTVVLGGGWLLGGGTSWTSRKYGFGVDNVVRMEVVLADGSLVVADACNEYADLFWALRGGGGGNFGIVTELEYIVHPPTPIVELDFKFAHFLSGREREFATRWMTLLIKEAPTLEREWGGAWNPLGARMLFTGTRAEAMASPWMAKLEAFYESVQDLDPNFGPFSTLLDEYDSFHDFNGGDEAYQNPAFDAFAQSVPSWYQDSYSRVLPIELLQEKPKELRDLIVDMWFKKETTHPENYIFGGRSMDIDPSATAIHPAMRRGVLEFRVRNERGVERLDELLEGYTWSVCYNHHSANEPKYEDACWGDNYARLEQIKAKYDPEHRFNVYHGVDFRYDETLESDGECRRTKEHGVLSSGFFLGIFGINAVVDSIVDIFQTIVLLFTSFF